MPHMNRSSRTRIFAAVLLAALLTATALRAEDGDEGAIGVMLRRVKGKVVIHGIIPGSPAEKAAVPAGAILAKVNGEEVPAPYTTAHAIRMIAGAPTNMTIEVLAPGETEPKTIALTKALLPLTQADRLLRRGDKAGAVAVLKEHRDLWATSFEMVQTYVLQQKALGNLLETGAEFSALAREHPDVATYAFALGVCYMDTDKIRAYEEFQKARKLAPDAWHPVLGLGVMLALDKQKDGFAKALRVYDEYAEKYPDHPGVHSYIAWCCSKLGQKDREDKHRRLAFALGEEKLCTAIGQRAIKAEQWAEAAECYAVAADMHPNNGGFQSTASWLRWKSAGAGEPWAPAAPERPELLYEQTFDLPDASPENAVKVLEADGWRKRNKGTFEIKQTSLVSGARDEALLQRFGTVWAAMNTFECQATRRQGNCNLTVFFPGFSVQLLNNRVGIWDESKKVNWTQLPGKARPRLAQTMGLRITQEGPAVRCFIDGAECATASIEPPYERPDIALRTINSSVAFKNLRIYHGIKLTDAPPQAEVEPDTKATVKCPKCETVPHADAAFCHKCGAKLK